MKKIVFLLCLIISITSCEVSGCMNEYSDNYNPEATVDDHSCEFIPFLIEEVIINGVTYKKISGVINKDITFSNNNKYLLSGAVHVDSGATLTIEPCTEVFADVSGFTTYLSIQRGGKINAIGNVNCPIVFKPLSSNPEPGDWGGIIINGAAQLNSGYENQGEGGTGYFGGALADDNSGVLSYIRVEYGGGLLNTSVQANGFSFYGVGSGTSISFIQAYRCAGDGINIFGGNVSINYAVSTANDDDGFDWSFGWYGTCTNWVVVQDQNFGDRGIEGDNNGNDNTTSPYSNPTISNIHLTLRDSVHGKSGIKLREGTKGTLSNIIIYGSKKVIDVQHDQTLYNVIEGSLSIHNVSITGESQPGTVFTSSSGNTNIENQAMASGNVFVDGNTNTMDLSWLNTWTRGL